MVQKLLEEPIDVRLVDEVTDPRVAHQIYPDPQYFHQLQQTKIHQYHIFTTLNYQLSPLSNQEKQCLQRVSNNPSKLILMESGPNIPKQRTIKALLCQINPAYKDKNKTIQRVQLSLEKYSEKDKIDVVVFPEMAFTGYNFKDSSDALPMAVSQNQGPQFQYARKLALRLSAYVVFGYIERAKEQTQQCTLYNSAAVLDRSGVLIANYRKCHLYYNDKLWAKEGSEFVNFTLTNCDNQSFKCSLAICMDINPKDFTSGRYQLADHLVQSKSDILLFLSNWVDSEKDSIHTNDVAATYHYWIGRLAPLILAKKCVLVLVADRTGMEFDYFAKKQTRFYGSSAAIMLNPHKIISNLDVQNQGFLIIDTFLP